MIKVTFGPSAGGVRYALSYAKAHASFLEEVSPGRFEARIELTDEISYGRAEELLGMVGGWKKTLVEIDESPERAQVALSMLSCARRWLRSAAACREHFPDPERPWVRCLPCPLYDRGWVLESGPRPEPFGISLQIPGSDQAC